jgi:hypothetical protein
MMMEEETMKNRMFGSALLLLALGLPVRIFAAAAATNADALPKPFTFARYQGMTDHSPFAVATKVEAPVEAPNFAKDLYIANAARSKEGDMVTVASATDKNFKKYLISGQPSDGYTIANIEWSDKVGATKVTISKDGQSATLGFNEALMRQPGSAPPPGANPGGAPPPQPVFQPPMSAAEKEKAAAAGAPNTIAAPAAPPNQTKAMPVPMVPTPQPRVRGVIPRNPNGT